MEGIDPVEPVEQNNNQNHEPHIQNYTNQNQTPESKTLIGALCGVFLGIIGLIIGLLLYKENSMERKTFIKGWLWAFIICTAAGIILTIVLVSVVACVPIAITSNMYY